MDEELMCHRMWEAMNEMRGGGSTENKGSVIDCIIPLLGTAIWLQLFVALSFADKLQLTKRTERHCFPGSNIIFFMGKWNREMILLFRLFKL